MSDISFALTAVTINEEIVRARAQSCIGRLIELVEGKKYGLWNEAIYQAIGQGQVAACIRSDQSAWLLLHVNFRQLCSAEMVHHAKDASGTSIPILARLFFQADAARSAPHGYVQYAGALHLFTKPDDLGAQAKRVGALSVDLKQVDDHIWTLRMASVAYMQYVNHADKTARCFIVHTDQASGHQSAVASKKSSAKGKPAYVTTSATDRRIPWKGKKGANSLDRYGALLLLMDVMQKSMGMSMLPVTVVPLQQYRDIGTKTQAKKELMHVAVMLQVAELAKGKIFHVTSSLGKPEYLADIMRAMFPASDWRPLKELPHSGHDIEYLLAVVNNPSKDIVGMDDIKVRLRNLNFPVLQCLTEETLGRMHASIERRRAKVEADAEEGHAESRRPLQEHEAIARVLMVQLLIKREIWQGRFLLPRPWQGKIPNINRYAFVYHELDDPKWLVVEGLNNGCFRILEHDRPSQIQFGERIPVLIDPPDGGKDQRGKHYADLLGSASRAVVIRNTEINAYGVHRAEHSGVWLIPEIYAYLSQGSDAASSDLSLKAAPRLRLVEAYEYGLWVCGDWRFEALLDMASLAYDPTVRPFRTAAYPVFAKLAAEYMDALIAPGNIKQLSLVGM